MELGKKEILITDSENQNSLEVPAENFLVLTDDEKKCINSFYHSFESRLTSLEYVAASKEFLSFVAMDIDRLTELRRDHLILYQKHLQQKGLAKKTILKKISALSSFLKHLAHEGYVTKDLSYGLKRPKSQNKRETGDFSEKDVKKIFEAMNPKKKCFTSHRALLAIGFYTGLRSKEILSLRVKNIGEVKGHKVLNLIIKGNKPHEIPLNPFAWHCLKEHLAQLGIYGFNIEDPEQCLFPSLNPTRNQPISQQALIKIFKSRLKDAGVELSTHRRHTPHSMRATLAGHLLNKVEAPLEQVQKTLGHSSPTTTMKYNKRELEHEKSPVYKIDY